MLSSSMKTWSIIILANLLILGGAAVFIAWLADRVKFPKFNIDQAAINNFNFTTTNNNLTADFIFIVRSHSVDKKYTLFYDHLAVSVYHNNYSLGFETLGSFAENDRRDDIVFTTHPTANNVHISDKHVADKIVNETKSGHIEVEVMIRASVSFEAKGWKRKQYLLKMMCFPLVIDLKTGKSFESLDCNLDNFVTTV